MDSHSNGNGKNGGGRPRKFSEPSRAITLTLPESTLDELKSIDHDRGQAIVKLAHQAIHGNGVHKSPVSIVQATVDTGLVVIGPSQALRRIPFVRMVEVAPERFILALEPGKDFVTLEIAVNDVLDELPPGEEWERQHILQLLEEIRRLRKSERVRMAEILLIKMEENGSSHPSEVGIK
ncbi:MAG TPA: hypothetical protein VGM62_07865 [Chthoniobacterales bacterium]|jgi:hypothetical protein